MVDRTCSVEGCTKPAHHNGWCSMHDWRWKQHGSFDLPGRPSPPPCSISGCDRPAGKHGWCRNHRRHWRETGRVERKSIEERYEEKVDRSGGPDACHPWTAETDEHGYGKFSKEDWRSSNWGAHRWGFQRFVGPLAPGEIVRHTCDNPPCQNRRHWIKGTQADNIRDMVARGRVARGEQKVRSVKLTEASVRVILASPAVRGIDLAAQFGVSQQTICDIRKGRRWGWMSR